ncbi:MAG TPA: acyl-CoA dehydrogenase family protein [Polyangiaceae bacterium]|nr:acyl-CoA dehydrogenase family protein [Polyangiaceae bacterium]
MGNFLKDNDDLSYYVNRGIDWDALAELAEGRFGEPGGFESVSDARQFYRDAVEMIGEFTAEEVAPYALQLDSDGVKLENGEASESPRMRIIFEKLAALELHGIAVPRELGGQNAPTLLYFMAAELIARSDVSAMTHYSFHAGIAQTLLLFSLKERTTEYDETGRLVSSRFKSEIGEIVRGEAWGCMDITEPGAGSDMANLSAYAEQDEKGDWYITGQKVFISSGHAKHHVVIARTDRAEGGTLGLRGLGLFLVPGYEDDANGVRRRIVGIDRVEEKMGHHGSVTAALNFDRAPGQLIGKPGEGFDYMLLLMNGARLSVGFECIGLCEAAYRLALAYAAERRSMGKTIDRHEMIADYLDEMEMDVRGLRALGMHAAVQEEYAQKLNVRVYRMQDGPAVERKRLEQAQKRYQAASRRATPLLKYLAAEKAVDLARRAIQVLGGAGYIREYGAEKLLRDAMVMPIYEGTSQIQSLMAMRDVLGGLMKNPQAFVKRLAQTRWRALSARDVNERRVARIQLLSLSAQQHLLARTAGDKFRGLQGTPLTEWPKALLRNWDPKRDFAYAMLHAERLTRLLADEHIVEILLEQSRQHLERARILERYLDRAEPRCRFLHEEITTTGQRLLTKLASLEETRGELSA